MTIAQYRDTRDLSQPYKLIQFTYSNGISFNYTDSMDAINLINDGRSRVYISIDRSAEMGKTVAGGLTRFQVAKDAAIALLTKLREDTVAGNIYDIVVSNFVNTESRTTNFAATVAQIDALIAGVAALAISTNSANYQNAFTHGVSWFTGAGPLAKSRNWIILTGAEPSLPSLPAAKHLMAPIITRQGSEGVGYIGTDVYLISCGNPNLSRVRFFDNTPSDGFPVIYQGSDSRVTNIELRPKSFEFESTPMQLDDIKVMAAPEKNSIKLVLPKESAIAEYHLLSRVDSQMFVTIKKGQIADGDRQLETIFSGRVISVARDPQKSTITMTCESLISSMRRNGLGRHYSRNCPHVLYGDQCKADQSRVTSQFTSTMLTWITTNKNLLFNAGFVKPFPDERYRGGMVWWNEDGGMIYRTIVRVLPNGFRLNGPILNAYIAPAIFFSIGCDHTPGACRTWHFNSEDGLSNGVNYGGQDKIPLENPFKLKSQYY